MPVLSGDPYLQTVRTQIGIDKISGQILIQTVWLSDWVIEVFFLENAKSESNTRIGLLLR